MDPSASVLSARAIVCPKNKTTHKINEVILKISPGETRTYRSVDTIQSNGCQSSEFDAFYPTEYLNEFSFPSIPPHKLLLKIGTPIMLIRNMNQREGLCNGTQLLPNIIEGTIITGTCTGKQVYLPHIKFIHKSADIPFTFIRKQFPVKVCYA